MRILRWIGEMRADTVLTVLLFTGVGGCVAYMRYFTERPERAAYVRKIEPETVVTCPHCGEPFDVRDVDLDIDPMGHYTGGWDLPTPGDH